MAAEIRALEFFCGIGGMHCALKRVAPHGVVLDAFDVSPIAAEVYDHNFLKKVNKVRACSPHSGWLLLLRCCRFHQKTQLPAQLYRNDQQPLGTFCSEPACEAHVAQSAHVQASRHLQIGAAVADASETLISYWRDRVTSRLTSH